MDTKTTEAEELEKKQNKELLERQSLASKEDEEEDEEEEEEEEEDEDEDDDDDDEEEESEDRHSPNRRKKQSTLAYVNNHLNPLSDEYKDDSWFLRLTVIPIKAPLILTLALLELALEPLVDMYTKKDKEDISEKKPSLNPFSKEYKGKSWKEYFESIKKRKSK